MYRHPFFDLLIHEDRELESWTNSQVVERTTLQEWPLSFVQRLALADGRRLVYKAQTQPSVEAAFYAHARSRLLPRAETIPSKNSGSYLLVEFIDAPTLEGLHLNPSQTVEAWQEIRRQIDQMDGGLPFYLDISSREKWQATMDEMLAGMRTLVEQGKFRRVNQEILQNIRRWAQDAALISTIEAESGYLHGDLSNDNVFQLPGGLRVIDWQRPILGPPEIDLATLLESSGFNPLQYIRRNIVRLLRLLRIQWFTQCALHWFTPGVADYDEMIASQAAEL